ncbi:UNVERIFIED_CONTAM: hypothetical protein GTU68_051185 [Idotea baltica]|nr:hypothetical protein [Idotea baltica]
MPSPSTKNCPCGSGAPYAECCGPIHERGAGLGTQAEQLMRARYSAYVLNDIDFLLRSWHPDSRPAELSLEAGQSWQGLTIVETVGGSGMEQAGIVEFIARFSRGGEDFELHERSSFARVGGKWQYIDGVDPST